MRLVSLVFCLVLLSGCAKSWYLDEWTVSDAAFPGISALGMDEAREWFGSQAIYSETRFSFRDQSCGDPQFHIESQTEADFQSEYRTTLSQLGVEGEAVDILHVMCDSLSTFPGSTFIKADNDMGYIPWDGVFFRLERQKN